ncbi:MAG TPA: 2Fe-2S iron-sulfur cluster-binding protein [Chloroflexota bacterium]|nr:2Fe-2S iron-sulfur cluster-binding protein [Chloroflexota bacterium]
MSTDQGRALGGSCTVTYGADQRTFAAQVGQRLLDVILANEPDHRHVCGGNGYCTSCRVRVEAGHLSPPNRTERERLGSRCGELRLACQSHLIGDVTVIPMVTGSLIDWE